MSCPEQVDFPSRQVFFIMADHFPNGKGPGKLLSISAMNFVKHVTALDKQNLRGSLSEKQAGNSAFSRP